jgi:hypothetical protein
VKRRLLMTEMHNQHSGQGPVVLDIGADHGALVLLADAGMEGAEIEISPRGPDGPRRHVAVLRRPSPAGVVYAAVYSPLPAGAYSVWRSDGTVATVAHVAGGQITQTVWPDRPG